jgi:hypothetical protein
MRFEYLLLEIRESKSGLNVKHANGEIKPAKNLQEVLNSFAGDGWEFVSLEMKECSITKTHGNQLIPSFIKGFEVIKYWLVLKRSC